MELVFWGESVQKDTLCKRLEWRPLIRRRNFNVKKNGLEFKTSVWLRAVEAFFEVLARVIGIYLVYVAFNWVVVDLWGKDLSEDTLLSLLLLPALYVLRDLSDVIDSFTVTVKVYEDRVSVSRGFSCLVEDTLEYKSVENTEIITTLLGRLCKYSTVRLYSPGGLVEIPYVYAGDRVLVILKKKQKRRKNAAAVERAKEGGVAQKKVEDLDSSESLAVGSKA